jgi:hypothetical protein
MIFRERNKDGGKVTLPIEVIEKIVAKAAPIHHGSLEIILDETKPFINIIANNRERIETTAVPRRIPRVSPGNGFRTQPESREDCPG